MAVESWVNLVSSALAGLVSRVLCHPIDTCKSKIQSVDSFKSNLDVISKTFKNEGLGGFYKGLGAAAFGGVPGVCVYISTYEYSKASMPADMHPFISYLCSGLFAETTCCTIFVPIDVIKERLQVQSNRAGPQYSGTVNAFRTILKEEGLRGLYKGYGATLFSYGPFSALYFLCYEQAKLMVGNKNDNLSFSQNLFCAGIAGTIASFLTNPLDMAKIRFQVQRKIPNATTTHIIDIPHNNNTTNNNNIHQQQIKEIHYKGLFDVLRKIYQQYGIRGLFRGALTRVLFHTPNTAITMTLYEQMKVHISKLL